MKNYFTDIKKPKWYIVIAGVVIFAVQCMAAINLLYQFGGGYYLIIPVQLVTGYLNVMIYLIIQKEKSQKHFVAYLFIGILMGAFAAPVIIPDLYTSVTGAKGIVYGVMAQLVLAELFYFAVTFLRCFIFGCRQKRTHRVSERNSK